MTVYLEDIQLITPDDIPVADASHLGILRPDNTSITIENGVLTAIGGTEAGVVTQDQDGYLVFDDDPGVHIVPNFATVTKSYTPTESQQTESITIPSGYNGIEEVDITVDAISSSYVGSGITSRSSSDLIVSGATVTAPAGYYSAQATTTVASGTAGTPTATKGTVSNHAVSITPSVINTTGYITGGTKTGTAVSVSASELVSDTLSITSSGTKDVTNYANASVSAGTEGTPTATKGTVSNHAVSIIPSVTNSAGYITGGTKTGTAISVSASELVSGTYNVTSSGTKDVTNYASASVSAGGATALATKGSVSNHTISVTPSVTRTAGYITAGTATGTAVTVSASELVSDTLTITATGTFDVTNYATASVDVQSSASGTMYTATITGTGDSSVGVTYKGTYYSSATTFQFEPGDTLSLKSANSRTNSISIDSNAVGSYVVSGSYYVGTYDFVPTSDVSITLKANNLSSGGITIFTDNYTLSTILTGNINTSKSWVLPDYLDKIKAYAFYKHSFNSSASEYFPSLPSNIKTIEQYAFYDCSYISFSSLPSHLTSVGSYAFWNCTRLALTSFPSTLKTINQYAFYNCSAITATALPSELTLIDDYAFDGCTNLALTQLPTGIGTTINDYSFRNCSSLALTSLPSGITRIRQYAFAGCINNRISSIPSSVTIIDTYAFQRNTSITSISCDGVITTLGANAFTGISTAPMTLTSASFPNLAITSYLGTVFGSTTAANACQQLAFCDIGNAAGIAANAFANCYALQTLVIRKSSVAPLSATSAFTNTPMAGYNSLTGTVYVPSSLISSYQTASNWSTLYNNGTITFSAIEGSPYEL